MRGFIRMRLTRTVAILLALLAASPVTAPFMTCDWSELGHVRSDVVTHVSRHAMQSPDVKTPADLNTTIVGVTVTTAAADDARPRQANALPAAPEHAPVRVLVLRI